MGKHGNPIEIWDFVDLFLHRLAKVPRKKLGSSSEDEGFYNEFFNDIDVEVMASGMDLRRVHRAEALTQAAWANMPEGAKVVDVGCGTGDNLRYILRENVEFYGLEYAETTANIAKKILNNQVDIRVGSATQIPFPDQYFDLALCIEVLEHVNNDRLAMQEIARILKPNGILILSLPYRYWFPSYFSTMGHIRHYTRVDVEELLRESGFEVVNYLPNYPRWSRFANYVYVACRVYSLFLRLLGLRYSPVLAKLPFTKLPLMHYLFSLLNDMRENESAQDYRSLDTSTFLLARKL